MIGRGVLANPGLVNEIKNNTLIDTKVFKDFHDDEFIIVGYTEGTGKLEGCLASFECETNQGHDFDAPMNGTHEYLRKLWEERDTYLGQTLTVRFLELSPDGIPQIPKGLVNGIHIRPKGE